MATIKDVTERRRAEVEREGLLRRLSAEADRRSAFLASLQDGFLALSLEGAIEDVNERFCEIVGRSHDELVGSRPPFPWAPRQATAFQEQVRSAFFALERGERLELDTELVRPDGSAVPVIITAAPLFDDEGVIAGAVSTVKEITDRLAAQHQAEAMNRRLQTLVTVSRALAAAVTLDEVVDGTVDSLHASIEVDAVGVALTEGRRLRVATSSEIDPLFSPGKSVKLSSDDPIARVAREKEPLVTAGGTAADVDDTLASRIIVPLFARGRVIGVLGVASRGSKDPSGADRDLLEQVATRVATNVERARLFEAESVARAAADRARSRVERLQASTAELAKTADRDDVVRIVLREAVRATHADAGSVMLLSEDGATLELAADEGLAERLPASRVDLDSASAVSECCRSGRLVIVPTWSEWEQRFPEGVESFRGIARSSVSVPVVGERGVLGVIALMFSVERTPSDDDLRIVTSLAEQASVALERALAFEREHATADRLSRLQEVTAALSAATNPRQVGDAVLQVGLPALGAAAGALYTMSDDTSELRLVAQDGHPEELMLDFDVIRMDADLAIAEAVRDRELIFFDSEGEAAARYPTIADRRRAGQVTTNNGPRAVMPLLAGGEAIGALAISFPGHHAAVEQDRRSLATIATLVAQALERARLYATEHRVAQVLQESLLPQALRSVGPARVAARYLAAATEASVGGDWFEIVDLPDECIGIAVGDVVGNGILAATAMGQLRSALRALALAGKKPGEILDALDVFAETTEGAVMSTAAYAEFDTRNGTLCYVSAGHPPPLVVGPGEPRFLEDGRRTPLGVRPPSPPPPEGARDSLGSGETVILYTDGLVERRDEHLDTGLARLVEIAARFSDRGPDMLAERLVQNLLPDGSVGDDAAVLCLRFEPTAWIEPGGETPSRFDHRFPARAGELAKLRASMRGWLGAADIEADDTEEIVLAVDEACANAIEHGSGDGSGEVLVSLELEDEDALTATVTNPGTWKGEASPGRGYGLMLMDALMDEVVIEPGDHESVVTLRRRVRSSV